MRIAQLGTLTESIPPFGYGGIELIVSSLTEELVRRGHQVTLFASGDSRTQAELVSVVPRALRLDTELPIRRWAAYDLRSLLELERRQDSFEIIHNHMGYQALPFLRSFRVPSVTTLHNPVKDYCRDIFLTCRQLPYVAISNAYRRLNYAGQLNYVATIYNGIEIERFNYDPGARRDYLLFLGRICYDKGAAPAIEIARRLGIPLKMAGKLDPADRQYYEEKIKLELKPPDIEYLGEVDFAGKVELYSKAVAVVYPLAFDEPFGLVMAEALASGTPVMALDRGSVREVVADGQTGIVAASPAELVDRFGEIQHIRPEECRRQAEANFSTARMVDAYELLYGEIVRSQSEQNPLSSVVESNID
jgi:glycosyltransferase involved in cell wall biosynthesis